ncbi:hypothetical protein F0344_08005 [Streptomyces finlayi]|uniref:Uncharacterized protein n=1 Tax=Streptomyces finlayi TaxID=67296 RepID=A0A7G7BGU7_9ACTN|nr:hypothetical protein [Streptomyces finlayi]QNE74562.1 hypothetical protein F0344_08005 [Streptomyces finlayi]
MTTPGSDQQLFEVPTPPTPPEQLLLLAAAFTRHNDALVALNFEVPLPGAAIGGHHVSSAQRLARGTLAAINAVKNQPLYHHVETGDTLVRLNQLAYLATESADHLIDASDILSTAARKAAGLGDEHAHPSVISAASRRVRLAGELTALAPRHRSRPPPTSPQRCAAAAALFQQLVRTSLCRPPSTPRCRPPPAGTSA